MSKTQQMSSEQIAQRRKGLRRTIAILVVIALAFYLFSFAQILLIK